jgi:hypothetical protein
LIKALQPAAIGHTLHSSAGDICPRADLYKPENRLVLGKDGP